MDGPQGGRGRWSRTDVPRSGWECVDVEDLEHPAEVCEMCEQQIIRYVHHMYHPRVGITLRCGCVCAGHMEGDLERAAVREAKMKSEARRRAAWPDRKGWRLSQRGNPTIRANGFRITVFKKSNGWSVSATDIQSERTFFARRASSTVRQAQMAAFDMMLWMSVHVRDRNA